MSAWAGPVFTPDADLQVSGANPPIAIREDLMVVGEPGFELTPQVNYASIFADLGTSLGLSGGAQDAAVAIGSALKIIAELQDGLQEVGAAHTFRRNGWSDRWTFADTSNNWDAAVRSISFTPRIHDYEYGRLGSAVAFAGEWVVTGAPAVRESPLLSAIGGVQDFWHETGAVMFALPGWTAGFQKTGYSIAETGSWMNLGSLVAGSDGFAAVTSGPKRSAWSLNVSSGTPGVLHLFQPLQGVHPWGLARSIDFYSGPYPEIRRLANAGPDLLMVRSAGNTTQVSVLKNVATHLAAGMAIPEITLLSAAESGALVGVASDGSTLVIGLPSLNQIRVFRRSDAGEWVDSQTLAGAAGEQIGSLVGIGGRAIVSLTSPGGSVIAAWRELAGGAFSRYASQDAGRTLTSLSFHPESMALIGASNGRTLVQSTNLTRSFRVQVKDSGGNALPLSTFKIMQINKAHFSGSGSRMMTNIRRHFGPPRKIWVEMNYVTGSGTLAQQADKRFYYDLSGPEQNTGAPLAERWFPHYNATHLFEGRSSASYLFEADGSRIPEWSDGNRPNGYLINPRIYDASGTPVPAQQIVSNGEWNLTWSFSPDNQARVSAATLCIENDLSPYVGNGYMRGGQTITADAQGFALIEGMDKGSYLLEMTGAYSGRSLVINLQDYIHDDHVSIIASGRGVIRGNLTADTSGASGYGFSLFNPLAGITISVAGRQVVTDANGAFEVTGLSPGNYTVDIPPEHVISGGNIRTVTVSDNEPETTLWLREIAAGSHSLALRDGSGNRLSGVTLVVTGPFGYQRTLVSAADGSVSLGVLLSGAYMVRVEDNALPWGSAAFPITVAGALTQVTLQPRGQSRVVGFGRSMAGKTARFKVTSAIIDSTLTSEWTYVEPADTVLRFRTYSTLQKTFRLPITVSFTGPCEIVSAEVGVGINMRPPTVNQGFPLLEAKPAVGLEDPYREIAAPLPGAWNRLNNYDVEIFDRTIVTMPVGRLVASAGSETWNIVLEFAQPEVPAYLYKRIQTDTIFTSLSGLDTYLKLKIRSPDGLIREFSSPIGADGQVTVNDLPEIGHLHARVDALSLVPGTESAFFDVADASEWNLDPREYGRVEGVCRFADGKGAAHVDIALLNEDNAPVASGKTALDGSYRIDRVPVGNHRIRASRTGYLVSPSEPRIEVTTGTTSSNFVVKGAVSLPLQLLDVNGNPDGFAPLALESSEWRQELATSVSRSLNPLLSADAYLQAAVTVDEDFDLGKLRLYFEGGIGNYEPFEAGLVLAHPDGTRLVVQDQRLDYYSYWRLFTNSWHEDAAPVPPLGYSGSRWSWSWQYGSDYSKRTMRPLDLFSNLAGRTSKGTWFIGIGPAVYDAGKPIDTRIHRVILAMSPRTPLQPQTVVSSAGTATFDGLTPGPYSLSNREEDTLPRGLSMMLRGGFTAPLTLSTRPPLTGASWPLLALKGGRYVITSPVSSVADTTYRWFRNGELIAMTDNPECIIESASAADVGLYEVEAANPAWRVRAEAGSLTVKLDPGFVWDAPEHIVQGDASSVYQSAVASAPGTVSYDIVDLSSSEPGAYKVTASFTPADGDTYATVSISRTIRVKLPVSLAWDPPASLAPDAPAGDWQSAVASVPGVFTYTPEKFVDLAGQSVSCTVSFQPDDSLTYATATLARTINVLQDTKVSWNPPSQVARTGSRSAIRSATANVPGIFTYEPYDLENAAYGKHRINLTFTPDDPSHAVRFLEAEVSVSRFICDESLLRGVIRGGAAWADVNDDYRLDLIISGEAKPDNAASTWYSTARYTGLSLGSSSGLIPGAFPDLPAATYGTVRWHDADGDTDLDLFHGGHHEGGASSLGSYHFFRRNGSGYERSQDFFMTGDGNYYSHASDVCWGDFDNDGDADLAIQSSIKTLVYRNNLGEFILVYSWDIGGGSVLWRDLDGDADLDLVYCGGLPGDWRAVTKLLVNDGYGNLTEKASPFANVRGGDMDFEDIDGDGDLDALLSSAYEGTHLYRNLGSGVFEEIHGALPSYQFGSVAFGDFDGDGDSDLIMNGTQGYWQFVTRLFLNNGHGVFIELDEPLRGLYSGSFALADHDADGDLDWVMHGGYFNDPEKDNQLRETTVLASNVFAAANTAPSAPLGLAVQGLGGQRVRFSWPSGSDLQTPGNSLHYNLGVWRSDGSFVLPPLSRLSDGSRLIPDRGNTGLNRAWALDLPNGTYIAAVQTIDAGLAASSFTQSVTFTVPLPPSPYEDFLARHPEVAGENAAPLADPDRDGLPNILEGFLGASSPSSGTDARNQSVQSGATPTFVFIVPENATFGPGPRPSLIWSGFQISVEGGLSPDSFNSPVEAVAVPVLGDQPTVSQGFKRVAFRLKGEPPSGFYRLVVTALP